MNLTIKSKNQLIIATKKKQLDMQYGHRCNEFGLRLYLMLIMKNYIC